MVFDAVEVRLFPQQAVILCFSSLAHNVHLCSQVKYKEAKKDLSTNLYSLLPETEELRFAKAVTELQSEVGVEAPPSVSC